MYKSNELNNSISEYIWLTNIIIIIIQTHSSTLQTQISLKEIHVTFLPRYRFNNDMGDSILISTHNRICGYCQRDISY